jgi:uracil phosphoribosyltransferase
LSEGGWEREHRYGPRVHLLDNVHLLTLVSRVSGNDVRHPELPQLVRTIYQSLFLAASGREMPRIEAGVPTRMIAAHPKEGVYRGPVLDPAARAVIVDIVRGGIIPAQTCFEMLCSVLPDENVRLDHLSMQRVADDAGRVAGVDLFGSKIGGSVDGAYLFLPDPMGATGSTTIRAIEHYAESFGRPARIVAMPMIATPEYLRAVLAATPDLVVYTARLDRGMSPPDVLETPPGTHWDRERGLNEHGYIVPGAGGMGEVLNNAWV